MAWCLQVILLGMAVNSSDAFQLGFSHTYYPHPAATATATIIHKQQLQPIRRMDPLFVVTDREADIAEMMMGGERYEMVPLPDRMCDTTLFVGNLCEFVQDEDLSQLFQSVSTLLSVPSCVIRKTNMQSLRYGFVSFPTVEEKEAAIIRYHGSEWKGKRIKVEAIQDDPKRGRVSVPERLVTYVSGSLKKLRKGQVNTMRNAQDSQGQRKKKKKAKGKKGRAGKSTDYVKLSDAEQQELGRACKKGFLTLDGRKAGHAPLASLCSSVSLKSSHLAVAHREWCDEGSKPNIILYKASGRSREVLDHIVVDMSPLRGRVSDKWRSEILDAGVAAEMVLQAAEEADGCEADYDVYQADEDESDISSDPAAPRKPIEQLPFVSIGFFIGERSNAKAMARELVQLWSLPDLEEKVVSDGEAEENEPRKKRHKGGRYENNHGKVGKVISGAKDARRADRRKGRRDEGMHMR